MINGHIKLDRKILDWEWYKDSNTKILFIHMLLKANWKDGKFEGVNVLRGSFVSSYGNLAKETGLSVMQIRTAIKHLILTQEITQEQHSKFSVFTIKNYSEYQDINTDVNSQVTQEQQASNRQVTTIEERKKEKKGRNKEIKKESIDYQSVVFQMNFSNATYQKTMDWLKYKTERKEKYTETGLNSLLKQIDKNVKKYGEETINDLVDECMANNWQGIIWAKLKDKKSVEENNTNEFQGYGGDLI